MAMALSAARTSGCRFQLQPCGGLQLGFVAGPEEGLQLESAGKPGAFADVEGGAVVEEWRRTQDFSGSVEHKQKSLQHS